ncbi:MULTISPECIES: hypothetical protein [Streptosporangium]|uniref:Uncharacterized protein n=1 Tax=Streptosporangium brasiliense TaxID=47480 RepID=A0ABT9RGK0_9ACTN|nr:hypothetical protein [Streptosporangium brasiliense]MDP9867844.1 hypothetical protein [Streptosporangium brasiliense]
MSLRWARYLLGPLVAAIAALVIGMIVGGTASSEAVAGLPEAGAVTRWGLPVAKLLADLAVGGHRRRPAHRHRAAALRQGHAGVTPRSPSAASPARRPG